jgi:hypothetical protein
MFESSQVGADLLLGTVYPIVENSRLSIYEVVGHVKRKMKHTSPIGLERLSRAPVFSAFISTLDSLSSPHNGARNEAKRRSVELSFHG